MHNRQRCLMHACKGSHLLRPRGAWVQAVNMMGADAKSMLTMEHILKVVTLPLEVGAKL